MADIRQFQLTGTTIVSQFISIIGTLRYATGNNDESNRNPLRICACADNIFSSLHSHLFASTMAKIKISHYEDNG